MNAVTCATWIKRGIAKAHPDRIKLTDDELGKLLKSSSNKREEKGDDEDDDESGDEQKEQTESSSPQKKTDLDTIESKYDLENYDDEEDDDGGGGNDVDVLGMASLSFYDSNKHDPYLRGKDTEEDDSDDEIHPDDNLVVVGKAHDDFFSLEVYVSNMRQGLLYCHHDISLTTCPLAIEWIGYDPGDSSVGNLVAVGNMTPDIELWDVDVINCVEPAFVLAGQQTDVCEFLLFYLYSKIVSRTSHIKA